jgi:hypothetical protein
VAVENEVERGVDGRGDGLRDEVFVPEFGEAEDDEKG